jgi:hypothetical protein
MRPPVNNMPDFLRNVTNCINSYIPCSIICINIYHKLDLMCLAALLLEGFYIDERNKTLNTIFCFYACNSFPFVAHYFHHKFVCMQLVTDFYAVYRIA